VRAGFYLLTLCLLAIGQNAAGQDHLVLLSPHWEGIRYEFQEAFKERYRAETGREVKFSWLDVGATSEIIRFVESQFKLSPTGIGVDLVFGGGVDPYEEFKSKGLLLPHPVEESLQREIPAEVSGVPLFDSESTWYAVTLTAFGIVCNRAVLSKVGLPDPQTWEDLTQDSFSSWIGAADPRKSGAAHMAYEIVLQAYGWDRGWTILKALARNVKNFSGNSGQIPKDVSSGEIACGLTIDSYAWPQVRELGSDKISFVIPQELSVINGDAIAVFTGAPNAAVARRFIDFMLSDSAQRIWLYKVGVPAGPARYELSRLSIKPALYAGLEGRSNVQFNPFAWQSGFRYDAPKGAARWNVLNDLIGVYLIDGHSRLKRSPSLENLALPSEAEIEKLSSRWSDPLLKAQTTQGWIEQLHQQTPEASGFSRLMRFFPIILVLALLARRLFLMRARR
jgi:iron(III) transport system substrate-binding protein